jgi:hypothetical protein
VRDVATLAAMTLGLSLSTDGAYMRIIGAAEGAHSTHHHRPHGEYVSELDGFLWRSCWRHDPYTERNHAKPGHLRAAHVHVVCEPEHVAPCQRDNDSVRSGNDTAIASQYRLPECCRSFIGKVASDAEG